MYRLILVSSLIFISLFYLSFPSHAQFIQPEWGLSNKALYMDDASFSTKSTQEGLMLMFRKWKGVKYKWGGTDFNGIDCSALTQKLYARVMHKKLPRTTGEQIKKGQRIPVSELAPGDLVFFQTKKSVRHVGVYVGHGQFMHASGSRGVTLSDLQNTFWSEHFETARHIAG